MRECDPRMNSATRRLTARASALMALVSLLALVAGCGHGAKSPATVTVTLSTIHSLGPVLTTDKGFALYSFPPDKQQKVTCTGGCADHWPPLTVAESGKVVAGSGVPQDLLGTVRSGGTRVVTYNKWPLYTYKPDVEPRTATGQALDLDGGLWYVLTADGTPVTKPYLR